MGEEGVAQIGCKIQMGGGASSNFPNRKYATAVSIYWCILESDMHRSGPYLKWQFPDAHCTVISRENNLGYNSIVCTYNILYTVS